MVHLHIAKQMRQLCVHWNQSKSTLSEKRNPQNTCIVWLYYWGQGVSRKCVHVSVVHLCLCIYPLKKVCQIQQWIPLGRELGEGKGVSISTSCTYKCCDSFKTTSLEKTTFSKKVVTEIPDLHLALRRSTMPSGAKAGSETALRDNPIIDPTKPAE